MSVCFVGVCAHTCIVWFSHHYWFRWQGILTLSHCYHSVWWWWDMDLSGLPHSNTKGWIESRQPGMGPRARLAAGPSEGHQPATCMVLLAYSPWSCLPLSAKPHLQPSHILLSPTLISNRCISSVHLTGWVCMWLECLGLSCDPAFNHCCAGFFSAAFQRSQYGVVNNETSQDNC